MLINREILLKALANTKPGLASKEMIEQTGSYLFIEGYVVTYNDDISVASPIESDIRGAVPAKELYGILNKCTDEMLEVTMDDNAMHIKNQKKMKVKITRSPEILLPLDDIPKADAASWQNLDVKFIEQLKFSLMSVSKNMARPVLTCIHWYDNCLESTDNYRITRCPVNTRLPEGERVLLPSASVNTLLKYKPIAVAIVNGWVHFKLSTASEENGDGTTPVDSGPKPVFSFRTFEGIFPNVGERLSIECLTSVVFPPSLPKMLDKATELADVDSIGDYKVNITIENRTLKVSCKKAVGEYEDYVNMSCDESFNFTVNPETLKQILEHDSKAYLSGKVGEKGLHFIKFGGTEGTDFVHLMVVS
jgi:DNA polymerase III sliding clamp (beta) subunit (PCNA family)